jgi:hypothetical protein
MFGLCRFLDEEVGGRHKKTMASARTLDTIGT